MFKFPDRLHVPHFPHSPGPRPHRRLWYGLLAILAVLSGALEAVTDTLAEFAEVLFDVVEESLEGFYRNTAHLDPHYAQMATAYTYLAAAIVLAIILGPRLWRTMARLAGRTAAAARDQSDRFQRRYRHYAERAQRWWDSLDLPNKIAVAVAGVLGAIPLFLLLSYGLGTVVAELL